MGSQGAEEKNSEKPESVCLAVIVKYTYTQNLPPVVPMGQVSGTCFRFSGREKTAAEKRKEQEGRGAPQRPWVL